MSTYTLRIPVIECDTCHTSHEGFAGVSLGEHRRDSRRVGWRRTSQLDLCPGCIAEKATAMKERMKL